MLKVLFHMHPLSPSLPEVSRPIWTHGQRSDHAGIEIYDNKVYHGWVTYERDIQRHDDFKECP